MVTARIVAKLPTRTGLYQAIARGRRHGNGKCQLRATYRGNVETVMCQSHQRTWRRVVDRTEVYAVDRHFRPAFVENAEVMR